MKVNSEIFRAYDIRGIVDEALTEEGTFQIGKAIGWTKTSKSISKRSDVFRV